MINLTTETRLNLLLPNTNKALAEAIKSATPEQLETFREGKNIKTILSSLFQEKIGGAKSDQILLDILKNGAVFKNMGNFTDNLKILLSGIQTSPELSKQSAPLEGFLNHISLLNSTLLKKQMDESGIFMESKIAAVFSELPEGRSESEFLQTKMAHDLKSHLLSLSETLQNAADPNALQQHELVEKLLTAIDYHQLISHLNGSNSLYFPFEWDLLEEGSMAFKKTKEKKFYCEINLRLKEYGELNLRMGLYEENQLEIQVHTEKSGLRSLIQEHLPQLRSLLIDAGLTPRAIRIFEMQNKSNPMLDSYASERYGSDLGFEVIG